MTEAHVCEQLAQGRYLTAVWPGVEPLESQANALTITPPLHFYRLTVILPDFKTHIDTLHRAT